MLHWTPISAPQLHDSLVFLSGEVQLSQKTILDVVQDMAVKGISRPLALQLKILIEKIFTNDTGPKIYLYG